MKVGPKISVLMITYNQENVIRRALDSLISQKEYLYEICINDDCSTDRTFSVLKEYENLYPDLVKPVQNNQNMGIFQNIEITWKRPLGDLIYRLAGDDESPMGCFESVINFIQDNKLDYQGEAFCIYGDYKEVNIDGSSIIYKNQFVTHKNALKLKIRQLLSNRSAFFTKKVLERYKSVVVDRSYAVELTQDAELQVFSDRNFYIPVLGNIYYAGIGVSRHFSSEEMEEHLKVYDHFIDFCKNNNIHVDKSDLNYIEYMKNYRRAMFGKAFLFYLRSIDPSLGFKGLQISRILHVLKKRIK